MRGKHSAKNLFSASDSSGYRPVLRKNKSESSLSRAVRSKAQAAALRRGHSKVNSPTTSTSTHDVRRGFRSNPHSPEHATESVQEQNSIDSSFASDAPHPQSDATPEAEAVAPGTDTQTDFEPTQRRRSFLPADDAIQREEFCAALKKQGLPLPTTEGEFHAARFFIDSENRAEYDVEQWKEYLRLMGNVGRWDWVDTSSCEICQTKFGLLYTRRHHCRVCNRCVCGQCSMHRFVLQGRYNNKPVRTCVICCRSFVAPEAHINPLLSL